MIFRKFISILAVLMIISGALLFADDRTETTAEEDYLSTYNNIVIKNYACKDDYDSKLFALQKIEEVLDGNSSGKRDLTEVKEVLTELAGEGILVQARTSGHLDNNFPDVRAKACELLGRIGSPESAEILEKVVLADVEPRVVSAAVKAMSNLEGAQYDSIVETIAWAEKKYSLLNPTSSLAYEILAAYEKILPNLDNKSVLIESTVSIATNYYYVTPVREKARELLTIYAGN
ncbi:MAG: HEAT repeat domain-containing protein [Treponema sp.]|nr:HEAT repeat domain-containing protein [Candidatus Treponema caballi]